MCVYQEPEKMLPVRYQVDVLVAGGGPAGVAAAVGAARQGQKVLLIEQRGVFGGMGTVAGAICGLYSSSTKKEPEQLVHGFAGEFYQRLQEKGGMAPPYPFGDTKICVFDPIVWRETADQLVTEAGVQTLFHTAIVDVIASAGTVRGAVIENKSGRQTVLAKRVIDATGDGDLCVQAGAPFTFGRDGNVQYATTTFRLGNVDVETAKSHSSAQLEEWINEAEQKGYQLPRKHIYILPSPRPGEILCNMTAIVNPDGSPIIATDAEQRSAGEFAGRRQVREYERFLRHHVPGFADCILTEVSEQLGIRQTRTIQGLATLKNQDVFDAVKSERSVAKSAWCIEAHGADGIFLYYLHDDYYDIPYECLLPQGLENILTCGRSLSAEHEALASARVTAQCFLTGYAAGCAAAISNAQDCRLAEIPFTALKEMIEYQV